MKSFVKTNRNNTFNKNNIMYFCCIYNEGECVNSSVITKNFSSHIYDNIKKYISKVLWEQYGTIMSNPQVREDLVQDIWLKIFSEIKKFNPEKGSLTTFVDPWIKHVVTNYSSKKFYKTSPYFANAIKRVNGAKNYCRIKGLTPDTETICRITGLSEVTVNNAVQINNKKDHVSVEAMMEAGMDYTSGLRNPEELAILEEANTTLGIILGEVLNEYEKEVLILLLSPQDVNRNHASYREVAEQLGTNVPKIKRTISRIAKKLKENRSFNKNYAYAFCREIVIEEGSIPVIGDDNLDIDEEFDDFVQGINREEYSKQLIEV